MALTSSVSVQAAVPPPRAMLVKQLLWPTHPGHGDDGGSDSSEFPSLRAIQARHKKSPPEPLLAFVNAAGLAQDRILVLDDYLLKPLGDQSTADRYNQILAWLPIGLVANDIRFLTRSFANKAELSAIKTLFDNRALEINRSSPKRAGRLAIEVRFTLNSASPFVHDRFAIIDNELWHFGATVGGLHNEVNAASRGWDATAHKALDFFDVAWTSKPIQRGRHV